MELSAALVTTRGAWAEGLVIQKEYPFEARPFYLNTPRCWGYLLWHQHI
jgi:hypothetical protein